MAKRLAMEATRGAGPLTTINQVYEVGRFVTWIDSAYEDIQIRSAVWQFLRFSFSFHTTAGKRNYNKVEMGVPDMASWIPDSFKFYMTSTGVNGEMWLEYWPWQDFYYTYEFGANQAIQGPPKYFTIKPDKTISYWPTPDGDYTISSEYYRRPFVMTADDDEPVFDPHHHMIIVWQALMFYAADAAAPEKYAAGQKEFNKKLQKLELDELPEWFIATSL